MSGAAGQTTSAILKLSFSDFFFFLNVSFLTEGD